MDDARFLPHESGGGPVHAPCLMRGSRFPDAGLPSGRLLPNSTTYNNKTAIWLPFLAVSNAVF